ncbi:P-type conjugative transfer protein TrbL [Maridesulfovibrio hydrothermalis]|nr:P-type conjugative transfer protein TrbL [Maridesulfovibrio hydrothermalis]
MLLGISIFSLFLAIDVYAQETVQPTQDTHLLSILLNKFQTEAGKWEPIIRGYSLSIFKYLLIIDFAWKGIRLVLKRAQLEEVVAEALLFIFFATFMLTTIYYYKEWSNSIINLFSHIAQEAGAPKASPTAVFEAGMEILTKIWGESSVWSPITSTILGLCAVAIIITFSMIAAQMMMVKCESFIVLNAGVILLGLGGAQVTREYAINFLRYGLSVALKLFVMQLLISLSMTFITAFMNVNSKNVEEIFVVLGASIIILALTMSLPDIVSGIVNGSHVSSGNTLSSAVTAVSAATMAAGRGVGSVFGGAVGAKRSVDSLREACSFANSAGKSGLGKLGHVARTGAKAMRENLYQGKTSGIRSSVKAQHDEFKMQQEDSGPSND